MRSKSRTNGKFHTAIFCGIHCAIFFFAFTGATEAIERRFLFRNDPNHFQTHVPGGGVLNWSGGFLQTSALSRLPRIIFDPDHPDYGMPDTERTITDARARARVEARESAAIQLTESVLSMVLDARYTIREKMIQNESFRARMGALTSSFQVASRRTGEGYVTVDLAIPLYGSSGLYDIISSGNRKMERVPRMEGVADSDRITGILIDLSLYPEFQPALFPEIYTDRGRKIYGPEMVKLQNLVNRGPVAYYTDENRARKDPRLGLSPYYVYAAGVLGQNKSNVFLDLEDAARILSAKGGPESLENASIVFIVAGSGAKK